MDAATIKSPAVVDLATEKAFRVGRATVDPLSREARFPGGEERLQPQSLKVLIALARQRGKVVTREQLVDLCWDGRFVGDDVINRAISTLRHFAERAGGFSIETVPRSGYLIVEGRADGRPRWPLWALATFAAGLAALLFVSFTMKTAPKRSPAPTIAILPFTSASADPAARELALATREALAHTLSEGQFALRLIDAAPQAGQPAADFVITGQVVANADKASATLRMEDTARHVVVFTNQFDTIRSEAAALPERIGAQVAAQLSWTAPMIVIELRHPSDPALMSQIFQGVSSLSSDLGVLQRYEMARRLVRKAPDSGLTQMSLAFQTAFALDQIPREGRADALAAARIAANRATELIPDYGDVYIPWCVLHSPVRMRQCEDRLRAAMRIDPDAPFVDSVLSGLLNNVGRKREAAELASLSLARDQYVPAKLARMLQMQESTGQIENASQLYGRARRWWPNHRGIIWSRWLGMLARGDFNAIEDFERGLDSDVLPLPERTPPALIAAIKTRNVARAKKACAAKSAAMAFTCMIGLARLGDRDNAFLIADRLYPRLLGRTAGEEDKLWLDGDAAPLAIVTSPAAAPLRRDARFISLAQRTGLLAYWRSGRLPDFCKPPQPEPICRQLRPR